MTCIDLPEVVMDGFRIGMNKNESKAAPKVGIEFICTLCNGRQSIIN